MPAPTYTGDGVVGVRQADAPDRLIDNAVYDYDGVPVHRQRVDVGNFPDVQTVTGTLTLDATALAALEEIQAAVAGTVALDAPTLAALENIVVSGTVALDSTTLAALEQITATVTGTVALDAPTLAALENITATVSGAVTVSGSVAVTNFPATQTVAGTVAVSNMIPAVETGLAKDTTVGAVTTSLGTDGTTPPAMPGGATGVRGWLRAIYERLGGTLTVSGTVTATPTGTQTVAGTVALDSATLAALESISAVVSGTVALDAPSLAALEQIVVSGTVALDAPTLAALENVQAAVTGTVALDATTLAALENVTATVSGAVTVSGTVAVSNFPATQAVSGTVAVSSLPEVEVKNDSGAALTVKDDYAAGEILADQVGSAGVLTFTFSSPVHLVWVTDIGAGTANISRADPYGGTPTATSGIPVLNGSPTPLMQTTSSVKVWAPVGSTISVYGCRRD